MKVLMTSQPGQGHIGPLIPIAKELIARGCEVTIASGKSYREFVENQGVKFFAAGLDFDEARPAETLPEMLTIPRKKQARWLLDTIFMGRAPRAMLPALLKIVSDYDLVIHDNYEYAGALAAEKMNVPYVCCNMSYLMRRDAVKAAIGPSISALRAEVGLPVDKTFSAIGRYLDLRLMPIDFSFLNALTSNNYHRLLLKSVMKGKQVGLALKMLLLGSLLKLIKWKYHEQIFSPQENEFFVNIWREKPEVHLIPDWLKTMPRDRKTVYVCLGTVFNRLYPQVFDLVLEAARGMNINLIMTVGRGVDLTRFGQQPSNVYIKDYVDQKILMPFTDLCVVHGGFSTTMKGMNWGIPQLILPLSGDQPAIYGIANTLGVAVDLPFDVLSMDAEGAFGLNVDALNKDNMRALLETGLNSQFLQDNARAMKAKMDAMPSERDAVDALLDRFNSTPHSSQKAVA